MVSLEVTVSGTRCEKTVKPRRFALGRRRVIDEQQPDDEEDMQKYGLTLSSEEHPPAHLVKTAVEAEAAGFDFVSISDHFHPWLGEQGHSPFVWSVLGAISAATDEIEVAVGVTCPTIRMHPVINAHAAATTARLLEGRFTWGLGTGENLNEHVTGQ